MKKIPNGTMADASALELRVQSAMQVEELEKLLLHSATALFEIKKLLTAGGSLLQFFDDVEQAVTTKAAREVLHWKRENGKRVAEPKKAVTTGRVSRHNPEPYKLPRTSVTLPPKGKAIYEVLNAHCFAGSKAAGFWREKPEPKGSDGNLPFPVKQNLTDFVLTAFLDRLDEIEAKAESKHFKGWSTHRWTGEKNGSSEFHYRGWKWPVGYRGYIADGVLPSRKFYKFIMGATLSGLPEF